MVDLHPTYQVDERGKRVVVLSEEEFENLLALAPRGKRIFQCNTLERALGLAATEQPAPSDEQVRSWLDEHRMEKYG